MKKLWGIVAIGLAALLAGCNGLPPVEENAMHLSDMTYAQVRYQADYWQHRAELNSSARGSELDAQLANMYLQELTIRVITGADR